MRQNIKRRTCVLRKGENSTWSSNHGIVPTFAGMGRGNPTNIHRDYVRSPSWDPDPRPSEFEEKLRILVRL